MRNKNEKNQHENVKIRFYNCEVIYYRTNLYLPKLPPPPNPRETSERMNFNVIDKKQLI